MPPGGVPERSKGTGCKLVGSAFAGSNPAPATPPRFVFSIPGRYYGRRDFGNERLMTGEQWRTILQPHGRVRVEEYFLARRRYTLGLRRKPLTVLPVVERR